jgi:hypothetical protein
VTLLVDLAMLPGGGLYRTSGDLFGFLCVLALGALLARPVRTATEPVRTGASRTGT